MNSATELLLNKTHQEIWYRGQDYADSGKVNIITCDKKEVKAVVKGTEKYTVNLKFIGGGISRGCTCPYNNDNPRSRICKHIIATAILWDEAQGITRPSKEEIEVYTIPPPAISRQEIEALFENPLKADLETLRILAEETALGGRPRPHARLPNIPNFNADQKAPLSVKEVKEAFGKIERWSNRRSYDSYFCSGEMVAAFCEVLRIVKKRLAVTSLLENIKILRQAQKFHYKLIMELIDDSNGLHEITEAHLENIFEELKNAVVSDREKVALKQQLQEFENHRDDY